jgi:hypothetical protein
MIGALLTGFSVRNDPLDHSIVCDDHCESLRGVPGHVRSDNGPEFIAKAVREWIAAAGAKTAFIEPGSPWENGYCENFNSKLRDELLDGEIFYSLAEARIVVEEWRRHYNMIRPHSSLGYNPPAPETVPWPASSSQAAPNVALNPTMHQDYPRTTRWGQAKGAVRPSPALRELGTCQPRDRRLDPRLQPPPATPGARHEDTRRRVRISGLT